MLLFLLILAITHIFDTSAQYADSYCFSGINIDYDWAPFIASRYIYSGTYNSRPYFTNIQSHIYTAYLRYKSPYWYIEGSSGYWAYCTQQNLDDCVYGTWYRYNGESTPLDNRVTLYQCNYDNTNCLTNNQHIINNKKHNESRICIETTNSNVDVIFSGKYVMTGCQEERPYYIHDGYDITGYYGTFTTLSWDNEINIWYIGKNYSIAPGGGNILYCQRDNLQDCSNNWNIFNIYNSYTEVIPLQNTTSYFCPDNSIQNTTESKSVITGSIMIYVVIIAGVFVLGCCLFLVIFFRNKKRKEIYQQKDYVTKSYQYKNTYKTHKVQNTPETPQTPHTPERHSNYNNHSQYKPKRNIEQSQPVVSKVSGKKKEVKQKEGPPVYNSKYDTKPVKSIPTFNAKHVTKYDRTIEMENMNKTQVNYETNTQIQTQTDYETIEIKTQTKTKDIINYDVLTWQYKKISKWRNDDILDWIKDMNLEKEWNDKILEVIRNCECSG
eukprot:520837_1